MQEIRAEGSQNFFARYFLNSRFYYLAFLMFLISIIFGLVLSVLYFTESDYWAHLDFAKIIGDGRLSEILITHILYHLLVILLMPIFQDSSAFIVIFLTYLATAGLLYFWLARKMSFRMSMIYTLIIMIVGPIIISDEQNLGYYITYVVPNAYHNPTIVLVKPFAFALFLYVIYVFQTRQLARGMMVLGAILTVLNALAKPNYLLCLVPAIVLMFFYRFYRKEPLQLPVLVFSVIAPTLFMLAFQYLLTYSVGERGSISIDPFAFHWHYEPSRKRLLFHFLASIIFPSLTSLVFIRYVRLNLELCLAWLVFGIAVVQSYLLVETGDSFTHGNWLWGAQTAIFILFAVLIRQLWQYRKNIPRLAWWMCQAVLAVHVIGGIIIYVGRFDESLLIK